MPADGIGRGFAAGVDHRDQVAVLAEHKFHPRSGALDGAGRDVAGHAQPPGVNGATLHGPKGLWLHRNELYVADVDTLRIFNRFTGAPIRDVPMPNPFAAPGTTPPVATS